MTDVEIKVLMVKGLNALLATPKTKDEFLDLGSGICDNLAEWLEVNCRVDFEESCYIEKTADSLLLQSFHDWPHHSGRGDFPIPPEGCGSPIDYYMDETEPKWSGHGLAMRTSLIKHVIKQLQKGLK